MKSTYSGKFSGNACFCCFLWITTQRPQGYPCSTTPRAPAFALHADAASHKLQISAIDLLSRAAAWIFLRQSIADLKHCLLSIRDHFRRMQYTRNSSPQTIWHFQCWYESARLQIQHKPFGPFRSWRTGGILEDDLHRFQASFAHINRIFRSVESLGFRSLSVFNVALCWPLETVHRSSRYPLRAVYNTLLDIRKSSPILLKPAFTTSYAYDPSRGQ